jgi:hypothetical protein
MHLPDSFLTKRFQLYRIRIQPDMQAFGSWEIRIQVADRIRVDPYYILIAGSGSRRLSHTVRTFCKMRHFEPQYLNPN